MQYVRTIFVKDGQSLKADEHELLVTINYGFKRKFFFFKQYGYFVLLAPRKWVEGRCEG